MKLLRLLEIPMLVALLVAPGLAFGDVDPAEVEATIAPGASLDVSKALDVPEVPPSLDLCLMVDVSGSYGDDLTSIQSLDDALFDDVRAEVADSMFCLASFRDYPFNPWGSNGDFAYRLDQNLTASKAAWTGAISALSAGGGNDGPEGQYEALFQTATGAGNDVPPLGPSLGDVPAGQAPSFRATATKVVAITTDAAFHTAGDSNCTSPAPCPFPYPGPTRNDTVDALNAAGIKVIAIKAPGATSQMDDVANATGGSVESTGSSSDEIADAILAGISNLPLDISAVPVGCDPLVVSFDPPSIPGVVGPTVVGLTETIEVPAGTPSGTVIHCRVDYLGDATVLASQRLWITVPDVIPPEAACVPGVNPAGGTIPPAGGKSPGQNEDGFYELLAQDDFDADPEIFVTDANGSGPFGPFSSGDVVKITEAPGGTPSSKPIGGPNSAVVAHIKLTADAIVIAVDDAGNSDQALCLVPPPPK